MTAWIWRFVAHDRAIASMPISLDSDCGKKPRTVRYGELFFDFGTSPPSPKRAGSPKPPLGIKAHPDSTSDTEDKKGIAPRPIQQELRSQISRRETVEKRLAEAARHYNRLLTQSKGMQIQAKRLAHRLLLAQEAERKEISRDLHDEVAQTLAGINVQLARWMLKEASLDRQRRAAEKNRAHPFGLSAAVRVRIVHRLCEGTAPRHALRQPSA